MEDLRTEAERLYDAQRDGSLYIRVEHNPASADAPFDWVDTTLEATEEQVIAALFPNVPADVRAWVDRNLAAEQVAIEQEADRVIEIAERIEIHFDARKADRVVHLADGREVPIHYSRDQAERDARWREVVDDIDAMEEPEKSETIGYAIGLLDGMTAVRKGKTPRDVVDRAAYDEGYVRGHQDGLALAAA